MHPDPLFSFFGIAVDLYTICFVVGVAACLIFTIFAMKKSGYSSSASDTIILLGIIAIGFGLFSAIMFQSLYDYLANPSEGFIISGRMTFLGGLIGGVVSFLALYFLFVYVINPRLRKGHLLKANMNKGVFYMLRFVPISITIAHGFGRIGCFFAGCCYGVETDAWYGITFATTLTKVVPTQLFEAIFLFLLTFVMIVLFFRFHFRYNFSLYLISYGLWRFFIEFYRADNRGGFIPGISPSQFWALLMVVIGVAFIFIYRYFDNLYMKKSAAENNADIIKE